MGISKETIVEASINILNRDGVESLSMREIAKQLNVRASSLYWHIESKEELYGAIAEHMCLRCGFPGDALDAREYLSEMFWLYRGMLLAVRDSKEIFEKSALNTPKRGEITRIISDKLMEFGVKEEKLAPVLNMFNNYVLSFAANESRADDKAIDFDGQFLYGLEILFAGLESVVIG